jgi:phytoene dehydrogenase-like protein
MEYEAVVVGSGPNGLAAAITLAAAGRSVLVVEGAHTIGGGLRTAELTIPGFSHDVCSAIHPFAVASPVLSSLELEAHGVEWVHGAAEVAHPLDGGDAVLLHRSIDDTAAGLGGDGVRYRRLVGPLIRSWNQLVPFILGPLVQWPTHPAAVARFGVPALIPSTFLARRVFSGERARALFAGLAGHAIVPLEAAGTSAFALVLAAAAHVGGWPFPRSGAQRIADAMASALVDLGGEIRTGSWVERVGDLPASAVCVFDVTPSQLASIAADRLPDRYRSRLGRFRYGPGVFKIDYALDGPVPWSAGEVAMAPTVHVGGTLAEIAHAEATVAAGDHPTRPFVIAAQPSLFDASRAPDGKHTLWAYCHVPNGSTVDMTAAIERQIERFAPGFGERILARRTRGPAELEAGNPNLVGGDIAGGGQRLKGLLARPVWSRDPYATPAEGIWLCSASTPPGAGVHGMCGYHAARSVLESGH